MSDIVPEGFDLSSALSASSTTDESQRKRCPECKSTGIAPHTQKWGQSDTNWRCEYCKATFDEPVVGDDTE